MCPPPRPAAEIADGEDEEAVQAAHYVADLLEPARRGCVLLAACWRHWPASPIDEGVVCLAVVIV
eukprot:1336942-Pyramimonas_sp.AAC.1